MFSYLDAGTVNAGIAVAVSGVAGVAVVGRMYGRRALGLVSKKHRADPEYVSEENSDTNAPS